MAYPPVPNADDNGAECRAADATSRTVRSETGSLGQRSWSIQSRDKDSRRILCVALLACTLPLGLVWRLAPLHLSAFAFKYGGSALWAIAVYWVVAILKPRWSSTALALAAAAFALTIELLKLLYWPPLDRFRETLPGKLLLGRYFSVQAILAYWIAIAAVAFIDREMLRIPVPRGESGCPEKSQA